MPSYLQELKNVVISRAKQSEQAKFSFKVGGDGSTLYFKTAIERQMSASDQLWKDFTRDPKLVDGILGDKNITCDDFSIRLQDALGGNAELAENLKKCYYQSLASPFCSLVNLNYPATQATRVSTIKVENEQVIIEVKESVFICKSLDPTTQQTVERTFTGTVNTKFVLTEEGWRLDKFDIDEPRLARIGLIRWEDLAHDVLNEEGDYKGGLEGNEQQQAEYALLQLKRAAEVSAGKERSGFLGAATNSLQKLGMDSFAQLPPGVIAEFKNAFQAPAKKRKKTVTRTIEKGLRGILGIFCAVTIVPLVVITAVAGFIAFAKHVSGKPDALETFKYPFKALYWWLRPSSTPQSLPSPIRSGTPSITKMVSSADIAVVFHPADEIPPKNIPVTAPVNTTNSSGSSTYGQLSDAGVFRGGTPVTPPSSPGASNVLRGSMQLSPGPSQPFPCSAKNEFDKGIPSSTLTEQKETEQKEQKQLNVSQLSSGDDVNSAVTIQPIG